MNKSKQFTQREFEYFKECCSYWIEIYGIQDFQFIFEMEDLNERYGGAVQANCSTNYRSSRSWIRLNKYKVTSGVTKKEVIEDCAYHEVTETLLSTIGALAEDRSFCPDDYEREVHRLINTFEIAFKKIRKEVEQK